MLFLAILALNSHWGICITIACCFWIYFSCKIGKKHIDNASFFFFFFFFFVLQHWTWIDQNFFPMTTPTVLFFDETNTTAETSQTSIFGTNLCKKRSACTIPSFQYLFILSQYHALAELWIFFFFVWFFLQKGIISS